MGFNSVFKGLTEGKITAGDLLVTTRTPYLCSITSYLNRSRQYGAMLSI